MNAPAVHQEIFRGPERSAPLRREAAPAWSGADPLGPRLAGESIDDVDELGEAFGVFVGPLRDAVRHTLFDVKFEDDMADAPDRRFRRRQLLQNGDAETGFLDHLANAAELPFDALQPREDVALMLDVQRGRARPARGVDYSMRRMGIQSGSGGLFVGHLKRLTAVPQHLFTASRTCKLSNRAARA